jgi:hypothetical protein
MELLHDQLDSLKGRLPPDTNSGSLAMFAAIRRASSLVSSLAADRLGPVRLRHPDASDSQH